MLSTSLIISLVSLVSLVNANLHNIVYSTDSKSKIVYVSVDDSATSLEKAIVNCSVFSEPDAVNGVLSSTTDPVIPIDEDSFNTLVKTCNGLKPSSILSLEPLTNIFDLASDLLIAPGTKYCGPGNRSSSYDDLGRRVELDKCCRAHDNCPMSIGGFQSKYGLTNPQAYTSSRCDCDRELKSCLKKASETDVEATLTGVIYFNILKTKCFQQVEPEGQCLEYSGLLIKKCEKRAEPNATEPVYQFQTSGLFP
ncbi:phospholipase A2 [Tetranychus urticae]|uniref:Phospholipase A2-like central domain-containing protein n=1 Tax=Tetranychus urticae TaxID=32264 RepID=T1KRL3_TETUR|nr:phospholipase A2 [Tetranychus urticae]